MCIVVTCVCVCERSYRIRTACTHRPAPAVLNFSVQFLYLCDRETNLKTSQKEEKKGKKRQCMHRPSRDYGEFSELQKSWFGSGGIRTHASGETGALIQRLRPLGHATFHTGHLFKTLFIRTRSTDCRTERVHPDS